MPQVMAVSPGALTLRQYWLDTLVSTLESAGCSFMKLGQVL